MGSVYLIAGLGNPGRHYFRTRHNAGFMVVDRLAELWRVDFASEKRFNARVARLEREGRKVLLCKPETYMNASGEAIGPLVDFQKIPATQMLVVVDDADLALGQLRLRADGSSGGHHGLESIEGHLGTRAYARQRIGIGRDEPTERELRGHVLGSFRKDEQELLEKVLQTACKQIECWLTEGIARAMNRYNGSIRAPDQD
jgi:PTH1 family peptidyl-tRNA hydrolase